MTRHKTEPPGIRAIISKYDIKDAKDLDERLGIYQALADHDYTAVDKPAYEAMMEDIKCLRRKSKVCDILIKFAYKHFEWNDGEGMIRLPNKTIEVEADDYGALRKEILEYRLSLDKEKEKMTYYVVKTSAAGIMLYQTESGEPSPLNGVAIGFSPRLKDAKRFDKYLDALERCGRGDIVAMVEDGSVIDMEFTVDGVRVMLVPTLPEGVVKETFKEDGGDRFIQHSFRESDWLDMKAHEDAAEYYRRYIGECAEREGIAEYRLHRVETSSRKVFDRLKNGKES